MNPIKKMIDSGVKCVKCGTAGVGNCDCWTLCDCGWMFGKGESCRNPAHAPVNEDIAAMLARPGQYMLSDAMFPLHGQYVGVEVEADGTAHQLTPQGKRDGVLAPDGYGPRARVFVAVPGGVPVPILALREAEQ